MTSALTLEGVSCGYSGVRVVHGLDLEVGSGEVVALVGANGAGKSTTLAAIAGLLAIDEGDVRVGGESMRGRSAHMVARRGVGLVPESRGVFAQLTVRENLRLSRVPEALAAAASLFPPLGELAGRRAGLLSGGEQQMLALARVLVREPRVLLVDELSLGLAPRIAREILQALRRVASERRVAVLVVEQHLELALAVADRGYVLRRGKLVFSGPADELRRRRELVEASYLGGASPTLPSSETACTSTATTR